MTESAANFPLVTARSSILAVLTEPSEGSVIKPTPLCTMKSFVRVDAIDTPKVIVAAEIV